MHGRGGHWLFAPVLPAWMWVVIAVVGVLLIAAAVLFILRRRTGESGSEALSERQRQTLEDFETQVLALLSQRGGTMSQTQIVSTLGLPAHLVAEKLNEMECQELIDRRWETDEYTYRVKHKSA